MLLCVSPRIFVVRFVASRSCGVTRRNAGMQQVIASDHQEPPAGKTHRDARDEKVELHSVLAMLSSRKRDATRRAPVTLIQKSCTYPLHCDVDANRHSTLWHAKASISSVPF